MAIEAITADGVGNNSKDEDDDYDDNNKNNNKWKENMLYTFYLNATGTNQLEKLSTLSLS
jgi:hypothetical protein